MIVSKDYVSNPIVRHNILKNRTIGEPVKLLIHSSTDPIDSIIGRIIILLQIYISKYTIYTIY